LNLLEIANEYNELGIVVVPALNKAPSLLKDWNNLPPEVILNNHVAWSKANGLNMVCGKTSGVVALDIDLIKETDPEKYSSVMQLIPTIYSGRIGNPKKEATRFFQYNGEKARKFNNIQVEILSDGNNCCMPPGYNHQSKTNFQWCGKSLLEIDIDELPVLDTELIQKLDELNEHYRTAGTGNPNVSSELVPESGRCNHNSHNVLSSYAVALYKAGHEFDFIVKEALKRDTKINKDADKKYFECPSRKEWGGKKNKKENAYKFVGQIFNRNTRDIVINNTLITDEGAVEAAQAPDPSDVFKALWHKIGVPLNTNDQPIINEHILMKVFKFDPRLKGGIYFDDYLKMIMVDLQTETRPIEKKDYLTILNIIQSKYGITRVGLKTIENAVDTFAYKFHRNCCTDYLNTLTWDGTERVENFFRDYCGTPDTEYTKAISINWWVSMAARALRPGCKVDNMVILEGKQGAFKSSLLNIIGGGLYAENMTSIHTKDFFQNLIGLLILEIGELKEFENSDDLLIKRVVSNKEDLIRLPYDRHPSRNKRQGIMVGTTNERDYLKDMTGARRFWPIACDNIDLAKAAADRDQLFAEAVKLFREGETWWEAPAMAAVLQESRTESDLWEDVLLEWIPAQIAISEARIFMDCFQVQSIASVKVADKKRLNAILKKLGFVKKNKQICRMKNEVFRGWKIENLDPKVFPLAEL